MSRREQLIDYYRKIHAKKEYGRSSEYQLGYIQRALLDLDQSIESILDFGCGQSRVVDWLAKLHDAKAFRFDPAIPDYNKLEINAADLVICNDVLEHIPEEDLDDILTQISGISQNAFFAVDCEPAGTKLPNGENAHCTIYPPKWWEQKIGQFFHSARRVRNHSGGKKATIVTW